MAAREFYAKLVKVVDGDTIDLQVDTGFYCTHQCRFRLAGIDTPEHDKSSTLALAALLAPFGSDYFKVIVDKADKYGRWLVTIPLYASADPDTTHTVNQKLIDGGFA